MRTPEKPDPQMRKLRLVTNLSGVNQLKPLLYRESTKSRKGETRSSKKTETLFSKQFAWARPPLPVLGLNGALSFLDAGKAGLRV